MTNQSQAGSDLTLARSHALYQEAQTLLPGVPPALFQAVAGPPGRPVYVWLPAGGASCAATVRALDGKAAGSSGGKT